MVRGFGDQFVVGVSEAVLGSEILVWEGLDPSFLWDPPVGDSATPRRSGGWASHWNPSIP